MIEAELADASPAMPEPEADGLGNFVERQLRTYFNAHGDACLRPGSSIASFARSKGH